MADVAAQLRCCADFAKDSPNEWTYLNSAARTMLGDAAAEIERLRTRANEVGPLKAEIVRLSIRIERLRAALKPLAEAARSFASYPLHMDDKIVDIPGITLGQLRAAALVDEQAVREVK